MTIPATTGDQPPPLTAAQAVALSLLRDGFTGRAIATRTGVTPGDLYELAAAHDVTARCGTPDGHACHQARNEDPCRSCEHARGRADARSLARRRKAPPVKHTRQGTSPRRRTAAAAARSEGNR